MGFWDIAESGVKRCREHSERKKAERATRKEEEAERIKQEAAEREAAEKKALSRKRYIEGAVDLAEAVNFVGDAIGCSRELHPGDLVTRTNTRKGKVYIIPSPDRTEQHTRTYVEGRINDELRRRWKLGDGVIRGSLPYASVEVDDDGNRYVVSLLGVET